MWLYNGVYKILSCVNFGTSYTEIDERTDGDMHCCWH